MEYRDSQDVNGKGWEFEVTANPTRNLRLTFNAALPETESVNLQQGLRWYYYENLPIWQSYEQQYRDGGQTGKADEMKQNMETIASTLSSLTPGVPLNHTPDYTANFYGTYTFYNGPLKNFAFGLGANIRGKAKIGSKLDDAYDYYYSDSYYLLSGHIAWQKKVGKVTLRFQLNVSNILDNDDIIFMTYKDYTPRGGSALVRLPFQYRYLDPRRFIFSTTISF